MSGYGGRPWLALYPGELGAEIPAISDQSLADFAVAAMRRWGRRPAFENMGSTLSFADMEALTAALAAYLRDEMGLRPGDRVINIMPNLLQFPVALYAAWRADLVVVNANPLYTDRELHQVLLDARPRAAIVLENFAHVVERAMRGTSLESVIVTGVGDLLPSWKRAGVDVALRLGGRVPEYRIDRTTRLRDALRSGARREAPQPSAGLDDVAVLQFTGGTSGVPKAVELTNRNLLSNQLQLVTPGSIPLTLGEERVLAALPMYHIFCLTVNCLALFGMGAMNVLVTNPRKVRSLVRTIARTRPTVTMLVSTLADALLRDPLFQRIPHDYVKLDIAGGMSVLPAVSRRWQEITGHPLLEGYGLTEASPVVALNPVWGGSRPGTIGLPLPSTEVRIVDDAGADVAPGKPGELLVRGPQVMRGYHERPEETAAVLSREGWLRTGDIATMDDDGFLSIVDRKKDLIVVGGFNVYPNEVEAAIRQDPKVAEVGVVGIPDAHSGEVVKAVVVKADPSLTEEELRAHCRAWLTGYKRPRVYEFVDELPKTAVGKVLRRALRGAPASE